MNWKFWQKEKPSENFSGIKEAKLEKPKEIPQRVGMHLVTKLKVDPDWVWGLKAAMRPKAYEKNTIEIRIFNPATAGREGVVISNFNSLDAYPNMILFFGSFNKKTGSVLIEKTVKNAA
jgi:hypothetical protein